MKRRAVLLFSFFAMILVCEALQRSDLSAAAQALVPEGGGLMTIVTRDGKTHEGIISMETPIKIMLKVKKPGGSIYSSVPIMKSDIRKKEAKDITEFLFNKLMEYDLGDTDVLPESEYRSAIELFDEFLKKAGTHRDAGKIKTMRASFASELANLGKGLKKVGGEWATPVIGTVKEFDLISDQMKELEKRSDYRTNTKVKDFHASLIEKRRMAVRSLPGLVRATIPQFISKGNYDTAVKEVISFMQFWCDQVVMAEGPAAQVMKQMDFDQIIRLEQMIMKAYIKAGKGKSTSGITVRDKTMVVVPGGYFLMGNEGSEFPNPDFPLHLVYVAPFAIGKYEVTNKQYRKFIDHIKKTGDSSMDHPNSPLMKKHDPEGWKHKHLSKDNQPVVGIDWFDAYAYAKWKGLRLPTEAEWEKAASTMAGLKYPWGNKAPKDMEANFAPARAFMAAEMDRQHPPQSPPPEGGCSCVQKEVPPPQPTTLPRQTWDVNKQLPQRTIDAIDNDFMLWRKKYKFSYGAMHMAGNAAEWVYDFYDPAYYSKSPIQNPKGPAEGDKGHVFKGGSYLSTKSSELLNNLRSHPVSAKQMSGLMPDGRPFIGFRVVRDLGKSGVFHEDIKKDKDSGKSFNQFINELDGDKNKKK
jgi:formylglycine-generating enzyme required for sulfatase activity